MAAAFIENIETDVGHVDQITESLDELKRQREEIDKKINLAEKSRAEIEDFRTLRTKLAKAVSWHFKDCTFLDLLPFYGVAPLFGLNPQVPIPVDVQPIPDMGMTMVTLEPSRDVQKYSMCTVMGGIWRGVLLLDDDHPVFWYDDDDSDRTRGAGLRF